MADDQTDFNMKGIDDLLKALKNPPMARVGILGSDASQAHGDGGSTNAQIGACHEYGTANLPIRSFLMMPISVFLFKRAQKAGFFDKETLARVLRERSLVSFVKKFAVLAEGIVGEAFASNGFGTWVPHSPHYKNNTGMILVDTQQLRNSITSDVEGEG